jgi:hypothetical protein
MDKSKNSSFDYDNGYPLRYTIGDEYPFIMAKNKKTGEKYQIYWDEKEEGFIAKGASGIWKWHLNYLIFKGCRMVGTSHADPLLTIADVILHSSFWNVLEVVDAEYQPGVIH